VLVLSARAEETDRILGFEVGADDYVTKPFSARELLLRVRALVRRTTAAAPLRDGRIALAGLELDLDRHLARVNGEDVALTPIELRLITALAKRPGKVVTRADLLRGVWNASPAIDTRTVEAHVNRLRAKLGPLSDRLRTVRGVGYRLDLPTA
jgi:two-component system phosphate regulon response regulator PhoB